MSIFNICMKNKFSDKNCPENHLKCDIYLVEKCGNNTDFVKLKNCVNYLIVYCYIYCGKFIKTFSCEYLVPLNYKFVPLSFK